MIEDDKKEIISFQLIHIACNKQGKIIDSSAQSVIEMKSWFELDTMDALSDVLYQQTVTQLMQGCQEAKEGATVVLTREDLTLLLVDFSRSYYDITTTNYHFYITKLVLGETNFIFGRKHFQFFSHLTEALLECKTTQEVIDTVIECVKPYNKSSTILFYDKRSSKFYPETLNKDEKADLKNLLKTMMSFPVEYLKDLLGESSEYSEEMNPIYIDQPTSSAEEPQSNACFYAVRNSEEYYGMFIILAPYFPSEENNECLNTICNFIAQHFSTLDRVI